MGLLGEMRFPDVKLLTREHHDRSDTKMNRNLLPIRAFTYRPRRFSYLQRGVHSRIVRC